MRLYGVYMLCRGDVTGQDVTMRDDLDNELNSAQNANHPSGEPLLLAGGVVGGPGCSRCSCNDQRRSVPPRMSLMARLSGPTVHRPELARMYQVEIANMGTWARLSASASAARIPVRPVPSALVHIWACFVPYRRRL